MGPEARRPARSALLDLLGELQAPERSCHKRRKERRERGKRERKRERWERRSEGRKRGGQTAKRYTKVILWPDTCIGPNVHSGTNKRRYTHI